MNCPECNHEKGKCECLCCCSISKIGCVYCILPVLGYRQIKKILRKRKKTDKKKLRLRRLLCIHRNNSYTVVIEC